MLSSFLCSNTRSLYTSYIEFSKTFSIGDDPKFVRLGKFQVCVFRLLVMLHGPHGRGIRSESVSFCSSIILR